MGEGGLNRESCVITDTSVPEPRKTGATVTHFFFLHFRSVIVTDAGGCRSTMQRSESGQRESASSGPWLHALSDPESPEQAEGPER